MDIRDLHYVIAIAEEQSISKAAERLYMAQSSLSQFLTTLETNLEYPLFVRKARGVRLTEEGKAYLRFAYETVRAFHQVRDEMQDISQLKGGRVILGISTFRGSYLLPPVLNVFKQKYPLVQVRIVEGDSLALEQKLLTGDIDLALLVMPEKESRIHADFLMRDEICLIAHPGHPVMRIARKRENPPSDGPCYEVDIRQLADYEFVLSGYDTILGREARRYFQRHDMTPKASNDNLSALFAASMGAGGQGLAFTYYSSRRYFQGAEFISLGRDMASVELAMAMAPGRYHSRAAKALREMFYTILG